MVRSLQLSSDLVGESTYQRKRKEKRKEDKTRQDKRAGDAKSMKRQRVFHNLKINQGRLLLREYSKLQKSSAERYLSTAALDGTGLEEVSRLLSTECPSIGEAYTLLRPVACGANGIVLKAQRRQQEGEGEPRKGAVVAIKIVSLTDSRSRKECLQEALIHSELDHPNIVKLLEYSISEHSKYAVFVQEWMESNLLDLVLALDKKTLSRNEERAQRIIKQITEALKYLHSKNIIHMDVKLDNVLIDSSGVVKLCDFGSARDATKLSQFHAGEKKRLFLCTPLYSSPESLVDGLDGIDFKSDMWSLGVLSYILLSGYLPFQVNEPPSATSAASPGAGKLRDQILANRFTFHQMYWRSVSVFARDFVSSLLLTNKKARLTAREALHHVWLNTLPIPASPKLCTLATNRTVELSATAGDNCFQYTDIRTFFELKIYKKIKTTSINLFYSQEQRSMALKAFSLFERYIGDVTKTCTSLIRYLIAPTTDPLKRGQKVIPRPAKASLLPGKNAMHSGTSKPRKERFVGEKGGGFGLKWIPDAEVFFCRVCDREFDLFNRRHHCRKCGQIVCGTCSKNRGVSRRICNLCFGR